ncbi:MAG: DnaJ domain-containing protein [Roseiarcus sp.]
MRAAQAFEILGLRAGASQEQIEAAYRRLIKRMHPDVGGSSLLAKQLNVARDALRK